MKILHERGSDYILYFLHIGYAVSGEQGDLSPTIYDRGTYDISANAYIHLVGGNPQTPRAKALFLFHKGTNIMAKYKQIKVNLIPEDFQKLDLLANHAELTKAELIRQAIGNFSIPTSRAKKGKSKVSSKKLSLVRTSTNLNQIARHCNIKKKVDREVLSYLVQIEKHLTALL